MQFRIFDLLLPRETQFYAYMRQLADVLAEGANFFRDFISRFDKLSEAEMHLNLTTVKDYELKGDAIEMKIIDELHKTFITPLDREDIHSIAIGIDRGLDILNSVAQKIEVYNIRKFPPNVAAFSELIADIAGQIGPLLTALEKKRGVNEVVAAIHTIENKADYLFHLSMADLFSGSYSAVDIVRFKDVYEHMESCVDSLDYIGKVVRGVLVKMG
ncbi:MAG: DUF47 family protein [Kiritimatiellae bacterium]|jgi:hypothetical protein|nr:DUF47 family protein [Kiritimatiellia bacterium]